MADEIGLFEAIHQMRAMRRLKPDPVPDEMIRGIIDAGLRAPTDGDVQNPRINRVGPLLGEDNNTRFHSPTGD